jgi:hypothetical protein
MGEVEAKSDPMKISENFEESKQSHAQCYNELPENPTSRQV